MAPKKAPKAQPVQALAEQAPKEQAEQAPKEQAEQVKAPKEKKPKAKPAQAKPAQAKEQALALAEQTQAQAKQEQPAQAQQAMQAVSIVLIETNGTIKTLKTKEVSLDTLYKKCGFRVNEDFLCRHTWSLTMKGTKEKYKVSLWGKKTGKANFENKYDLPPPLDKELFFGTCALVRTSTEANASEAGASSEGMLLDLTKETWLKIYEQLFGGFEDIGDEDEYSEDELENVDPALLTKDGYLKDDFVVSDKEAISAATSANASEADASEAEDDTASASEADTASEAEDEAASACETASEAEEEEYKKKPVKKVVKKGGKKVKEEEIDDTSELEEEVYTFSDDDDNL